MDRLARVHVLDDLTSRVFLSQDSECAELANDTGKDAPAHLANKARGLIWHAMLQCNATLSAANRISGAAIAIVRRGKGTSC